MSESTALDTEQPFDLGKALEDLQASYPVEYELLTPRQRAFICIFPEVGLNYAKAAKSMGMSRMTCWRWRQENDTFDTLIKEMEEAQLDLVEQRVHNIALSNLPQSLTACIFLLNVKRGYATQTKQTVVHEVKVYDPCDLARYRLQSPKTIDITET